MKSDVAIMEAAIAAQAATDLFQEKLIRYHDVERKNFDLVRKKLSELQEKLQEKLQEYNSVKLAFDKVNEEVELASARVQRLIAITDEECKANRKAKCYRLLQDQRVVGSLHIYLMKKNDKEVLLAAQHDLHVKKRERRLANLQLVKISDELKSLKDTFDSMKVTYIKEKEICQEALNILIKEEKNYNRAWEILCTVIEDFQSRQVAPEEVESDS